MNDTSAVRDLLANDAQSTRISLVFDQEERLGTGDAQLAAAMEQNTFADHFRICFFERPFGDWPLVFRSSLRCLRLENIVMTAEFCAMIAETTAIESLEMQYCGGNDTRQFVAAMLGNTSIKTFRLIDTQMPPALLTCLGSKRSLRNLVIRLDDGTGMGLIAGTAALPNALRQTESIEHVDFNGGTFQTGCQ